MTARTRTRESSGEGKDETDKIEYPDVGRLSGDKDDDAMLTLLTLQRHGRDV